MLVGMVAVDDLDGVGEVFGSEVADPLGAVAQDDAAHGLLEAATK
jgi:hypothetical protein